MTRPLWLGHPERRGRGDEVMPDGSTEERLAKLEERVGALEEDNSHLRWVLSVAGDAAAALEARRSADRFTPES